MTDYPLFVSFYTPKYTDDARALVTTLREHSLPHVVDPIPEQGSWLNNNNFKAQFCRAKWEQSHRIVWVDADARIMAPPEALRIDLPGIAYHRWLGGQLLGGTLYFGEECGPLLDRWCQLIEEKGDYVDQVLLNQALREVGTPELLLPAEYCYIFDLSAKHYPEVTSPVILHTQASRRFRK